MKIYVNKNSKVSVFEQLYMTFENRISSGVLEAESKLPSIRHICKDTGVSHMTVVKVYEKLEENGLIEKIHGKGSFVRSQYRNVDHFHAERLLDLEHKDSKQDSESWQSTMKDYVAVAGFRQNKNLKYTVSGTNLSLACLGKHLLPTKDILNNFNSNAEMLGRINDTYPSIEGTQFMRESVVEFLAQRSVNATPEDLLITMGSQQAIQLIATTYIGPGDVVVIDAPTYPGAIDIFRTKGATIIEVTVDRDGMDMNELLSVCESYDVKLVYTMTSFQNPTGAVFSLERKKDLLELAEYHNFMILEDDVCGQLSYEGSVFPLKALDTTGRVLYVLGFSKIYGHALRLSVIMCPDIIRAKLLSSKAGSDGGAPLMNQLMMASYLNSVDQKHYLTDLTAHLKEVRDEVYDLLKTLLPQAVQVEKPRGGMLVWLTFPAYFNCNILHYKSIEKFKVTFLPGEFCYNSKLGRNQLRICFTSVEKTVLMDSIRKVCSLIEEVDALSQMF